MSRPQQGETLLGANELDLPSHPGVIRALASAQPAGLLVYDGAGRLVLANQRAAALLGLNLDQLMGGSPLPEGWGWLDVEGQHLAPGRHPAQRSLAEGCDFVSQRLGIALGSSGSRPLRASSQVLLEGNGRLAGVLLHLEDDTGDSSPPATMDLDTTESLRHAATTDALTGLGNRELMAQRLAQSLHEARRSGHFGAVLLIDLDGFKRINDGFGHLTGDAVLRDVAQRLLAAAAPADVVTRLGGDEMVVIRPDCGDSAAQALDSATALGGQMIEALRKPFRLESRTFRLDASIGVTVFPEHEHENTDDLIREADTAMYEAKARGAGRVVAFHPRMYAAALARVDLEQDLRVAIERGEFQLEFQAKVNRHDRLCGAEILLRWQQPGRGMVMPDLFVPLAEETGLIVPIGTWALRESCRLLAATVEPRMPIALNVSARQIKEDDFLELVEQTLAETGIDPGLLTFELTENSMIDLSETDLVRITRLSELGIRLSLDDFGTGYSSLLHLRNLPFAEVKVDQAFVTNAESNRGDAAIVRAIAHIADEFGLTTVAEGIETEQQARFMRSAGCAVLQGYLFARPMAASRFLAEYKPGALLRPGTAIEPTDRAQQT